MKKIIITLCVCVINVSIVLATPLSLSDFEKKNKPDIKQETSDLNKETAIAKLEKEFQTLLEQYEKPLEELRVLNAKISARKTFLFIPFEVILKEEKYFDSNEDFKSYEKQMQKDYEKVIENDDKLHDLNKQLINVRKKAKNLKRELDKTRIELRKAKGIYTKYQNDNTDK